MSLVYGIFFCLVMYKESSFKRRFVQRPAQVGQLVREQPFFDIRKYDQMLLSFLYLIATGTIIIPRLLIPVY